MALDTTRPDPGDEAVAGERRITPVAAPVRPGALPVQKLAGMGALVLVCGFILWAPWRGTRAAPEERPQRQVIHQARSFEPAREPPAAPAAPVQQAALLPAAPLDAREESPPKRTAADELLDAARRAPVIAYNRAGRTTPAASGAGTSPEGLGGPLPSPFGDATGATREPRNELSDRLKATPIEGVRAARLPNRHLVVTQGTAIPCVLETAMSSDVPGFVSCVVERDVMSDSGHVVLMEKGTQVVGEYRNSVRRGSKRMFVLWSRAKTPTGVIVNLASPATDALGRSGFDGEVDTHFWERFGAALLLSVVDDAGSYASRQLSGVDIEVSSTQGAAGNAAAIAVERSIDIPPTLNKNQGERVGIFVARDLDFSSVYSLRHVGTRTEVLDRTVRRTPDIGSFGPRITK
jgi:type IV secretion system protein VirB10